METQSQGAGARIVQSIELATDHLKRAKIELIRQSVWTCPIR